MKLLTTGLTVDILAIGAHPDDVELGCGGTIAKEIRLGRSVGILNLTRGELGTRGTPTLRDQESEKAAHILGVSFLENLNFDDGFIENKQELQLPIIRVIREVKPKIVLTNAIKDRHPDHAKAAKLVCDACFLSGLQKLETTHKGKQQEAWIPSHVYHYIQWEDVEPDFVVDISGHMGKKLEAICAYSSQFYDPNSKEKETPISSKNFLESITYRSKNLGRLCNTEFAEGYTVAHYPLIDSVFDLK